MSISINAIECPYCGAKIYSEDNDFSDTEKQHTIFCLVCEERFIVSKICKFFKCYFIVTAKIK